MDNDLVFAIFTVVETAIFLAILGRLLWVNKQDKQELGKSWRTIDDMSIQIRRTEERHADALKGWRALECQRETAMNWYRDLFVIPAEGLAIDEAMKLIVECLRSSRAERVREQNMRKVAEQTRDAELKTHLEVYAQMKEQIEELTAERDVSVKSEMRALERLVKADEIAEKLLVEKNAAWALLNENGFESSEYSLHSAIDELLTERAELVEINEKLRAAKKKGKR